MNNDILHRARALLLHETPMNWDCGRICDSACCQSDEDGQGGVFLFPGEEALLGRVPWAHISPSPVPLSSRDTPMLVCDGTCERTLRPLGCMIFPLTPKVDAKGRVCVAFDYRARPVCPLLRNGLSGLNAEFVETVQKALNLIASDPDGLLFLGAWQALEEQYAFSL